MLIFAKILHYVGIYNLVNITVLIRIYVGLMTAYSEVKILELSAMTFNSLDGAESTYQLLIFSWFGFYAGSRGLITTVETALFSLSFCKLAVRYLKIEVKF